MPLPKFDPPTVGELRDWYSMYRRDKNVRRLILEVQRSRTQLDQITAALRAAVDLAMAEQRRVLPTTPAPDRGIGGFLERDDDDPEAAEMIARASRRRR